MRLGIDFGTSRIVVAVADRGNFPVVCFEGLENESFEWVPSIVGVREEQVEYGWNAWRHLGTPGWVHLRSIKRLLSSAGPQSLVEFGPLTLTLGDLLTGLARQLRSDLLHRSNISPASNEPLQAVIGVPALANSNQRYLTVEAFTRAGFEVLALVNEPSAAAVEFGHHKAGTPEPESVLVYDFGGGTFDVSLVRRDEGAFQVVASESISTIGGDDFDDILAELALRQADRLDRRHDLTQAQEFLLVEECRVKKEALHANSRRMAIDLEPVCLGWPEVTVSVPDFYEACLPLVEETLHLTEEVLESAAAHPSGKAPVLYLTGGASELPLVGRLVRERFGRRVHRSAYMRSATAIGLAIHAADSTALPLQERFTRHFGLWREADGGARVVFDPLIHRGEPLPGPGAPPVTRTRGYSPAHNIGHFRFLECTALDPFGEPSGDLTPWDEIRFPFDPSLAQADDLASVPVVRVGVGDRQLVEEQYEVSSSGTVTIRLKNVTTGYAREYSLARWAPKKAAALTRKRRTVVKPGNSA
jgi:molecular chaperone DnaK (HSP70)